MARSFEGQDLRAGPGRDPEDKRAAAAVIGAHSLQHLYQQGFYVVLPEIYRSLGMTPVAAGALEMVRRTSGGIASMGGGFALDRFPQKRIATLYASLLAMGLGYLAVGVAPNYAVIVVALGFAGAAGSVYHPAGIGLLSQVFPHKRGFMIASHRSAGSIGDAVGPLLVGGLLLVLGWQTILIGAMPLAVLFAAILWMMLLKAPSWKVHQKKPEVPRSIFDQFRDIGQVVKAPGLLMLLLIAAFSGLGQGGVIMWLSLYLSETQAMGSVGIGVHIALLTGLGIVTGPIVGGLSDRIGRKPVITGVLACKALFATMMAITASGIWFSVSVALLGAVMFGASSLIQASALDMAHGKQLEGSMIGMLWGFNAVFTGLSPLLVGMLVAARGYGVVFWFVATVNLLGTVVAVVMPAIRSPATDDATV